MTDIVEELRWRAPMQEPQHSLMVQAANEIERLRGLLRDADKVVMWEHTPARSGFQEEIEAALGVGLSATADKEQR